MKNIKAIKFLSEGTSTISLAKVSNQIDYYILLEYSYNGVDWDRWDFSSLTINQSDALYIRGDNPYGFCRNDEFYTFIIKGDKVSCSGNIMSLIDYRTLPNVIPNSFCFCGLFKNCTALTTAPELPATELTDRCYCKMFYGCTSLIKAPALPAKVMTDFCYGYMFSGCTALTTAPELPAIELADSCYYQMFSKCSSLTTAPELPAKKIVDFCYSYMFYGCTSLIKIPKLPIADLTTCCYYQMFKDCILLK